MRLTSALTLAAALAAASCGGKQHASSPPVEPATDVSPPPDGDPIEAIGLPPIPDAPAPAPAALIATGAIADPSALVTALARYLDAVNPGLGMMATESALYGFVGQASGVELAGVDSSKPMWGLVLDPEQVSAPIVLVVGVADRAAFDAAVRRSGAHAQHHRGFAAVGDRAALELAAAHALSALATRPPPAEPTMTVLVGSVMKRYGAQIDMMLPLVMSIADNADNDDTAALRATIESFVSLLRQTEELRVRLDTSGHLTFLLDIEVRGGGSVAGIFARQPAATFELIGHHAGPAVVVGGRIDASFASSLDAMTTAAMREVYGGATDGMMSLYKQLYELTGEMALSYDHGGGTASIDGAWQTSDGKKTEQALLRSLELIAAARKKGELGQYDLQTQPRAFRHKGVSAARMTMRPSKSAPDELREAFERSWGKGPFPSLFAVTDGSVLMALGPGADKRIRAAIDRARSKAAPAPSSTVEQAVATAVAHKESLLALIDAAALAQGSGGGQPLAVGVGFAPERMTLRVAIPPEQARLVMTLGAF